MQHDRAGNISRGDGVIEIDRQFSRRNLRRVEIDGAKSLIVRQNDVAHDQVSIRVGRGRRQFQPGLTADELQLLDADLAGVARIQFKSHMVGDKIVRTIANNDGCVGNVQAFRKNIGQLDFLFWIRRAGSQRRFRRIHHNASGMHIRALDCGRNPVSQQREQPVVDSAKVDID